MLTDDVTVRPAVAADRAALGRYGGALMRQHHAWDPERFLSIDRPEEGYARFLVAELGAPGSIVLVAERRGAVVGYAYASLEPMSWKELRGPCGYLHDVYVDARVRGHGVGERLVLEALARLEARGAPRVVLVSAAKNPRAQALFARLGFRPTMCEMTCELSGSRRRRRPRTSRTAQRPTR